MLKDQTHGNVSENFTFDHLNLVVELYIMAKDFSKAFDTLVSIGTHIISRQHSSLGGAEFSSGNGSPQNPSVVDHLLSMLPLDLRVKLGICLIHQGELERAARHIAALDSFKFEMVADLHRDVAEAYIATRNHAAAMTLYDRLVEHEVFDMPETWAHLAECCRVLGHHERAVELYSKLSELFPDQKEIKLTLAELYDAMGDEQRANAVRGELRARKEATSIVHSLMRKPLLPALPVESRTNGTVMRKTHVDNDKGASSTAALDTNDDTLFVPDIRAASSATRSGKNQEVAERLTKAKLLEHREKYNKAKELWCKMNEDVADCGDMEEFRLVARSLLTDFHTCERFFNPHRLRPFKPPSNKKRGRKPAATKKSAFNEAVDQALSDYVSDTDGSDLSVGKGRAKAASSFRAVPPSDGEHAGSSDSYFGLKFSEWFMINAWFALFLLRLAKIVREERVDPFIVNGAILKSEEVNHLARGWYHEAAEILSKAEKASIFHYDFERSSQLHLLRLGMGRGSIIFSWSSF